VHTAQAAAVPVRSGDGTALTIEAHGVTKRFGGVLALDAVDFSAAGGEVHALLGENGAGKSTFVKLLTGAHRPDGGTIAIDGATTTGLTPKSAREHGVGAVFQELSLFPHLTGAENISFGQEPVRRSRMVSPAAMLERSRAVAETYDLPVVPLDRPVRELSIAQRQLLEIMKALAAAPRLLVLDEATSALGPAEVDVVLALTRRLAADGVLCIYISHRLAEVRAIADRITIFRNGRAVRTVANEGASDDEIIHGIIGRTLQNAFPPKSPCPSREVALRGRSLTTSNGRLRGVDLELHRGEVLGVGGLQGQGQLELFLRLFGVMSGGGTIEARGRSVPIRTPREALRAGVGFALVPEDRGAEGLLLGKSLRENLSLTVLRRLSRFGFIDTRSEQAHADAVIRALSIAADSGEQTADTLSGGNQQKVVIGKFLHQEIEVLLCFDPTRGVDVGAKHDIFELMHRQAQEGKAVLFFSTDNLELMHVPHRLIVMAGGRISAALAASDATEEAIVRAAMSAAPGVRA
jgi:ribose transport system ATP-binding protein